MRAGALGGVRTGISAATPWCPSQLVGLGVPVRYVPSLQRMVAPGGGGPAGEPDVLTPVAGAAVASDGGGPDGMCGAAGADSKAAAARALSVAGRTLAGGGLAGFMGWRATDAGVARTRLRAAGARCGGGACGGGATVGGVAVSARWARPGADWAAALETPRSMARTALAKTGIATRGMPTGRL